MSRIHIFVTLMHFMQNLILQQNKQRFTASRLWMAALMRPKKISIWRIRAYRYATRGEARIAK